MKIDLSESELGIVILALAKLSLSRPGWHPACIEPFVERIGGANGVAMYEQFRSHGPDRAIEWKVPE